MGEGTAHEVLLSHLCGSPDVPLAFCWLSCCAAVCLTWQAVKKSLPTLRLLSFRSYGSRVKGIDVMRALVRVADGSSMRSINLMGCCGISGTNLDEILRFVVLVYHEVHTLDVTGCGVGVNAAGLGLRLGCASPCELFELLTHQGVKYKTSYKQCVAELLEHMLKCPMQILSEPEPAPGRGALLKAAAHGRAWDVALLLSVEWAVGDSDDDDESDNDD